MIFFCSDLHLGHTNIIRYSQRPFHLKRLETEHEIYTTTKKLVDNGDASWIPAFVDSKTEYAKIKRVATKLMDDTLIDNINSVVKPNDTLYHLGDFTFDERKYRGYRERINCKNVHQIIGNHDKLNNRDIHIFSSVSHYKELRHKNTKIVLSHYAFRVWNKSHAGSWHLYGHSHGTLPDLGNKSFDVGIDCWNYMPISIDQVEEEMSKRNFIPVDHHTGERQ